MLALQLSPVPMVRGFGLLLMVGVAIAFLCALTAGAATLALTAGGEDGGDLGGQVERANPEEQGSRGSGRHVRLSRFLTPKNSSTHKRSLFLNGRPTPTPTPQSTSTSAAAAAGRESLAAAWRGARELLLDNPVNRFLREVALVQAPRRPGRVLCVGLALAVLGWGLDTQTHVETDIAKLVPQNLESLQNLHALEQATGVGGQLDLLVTGKDLTKPATIEWMNTYESAMLKRFGYSSTHGCGQARLCPAFSLPDLFTSTSKLTQADVRGLLDTIPPYFSQDVITPDRRAATLAFGIKLMSLTEQQRVIEAMRSSLHPPGGVSARLVGLQVLAAQSAAQVASPCRRIVTLLAGLAAVALVLLIAFRGDRRRALVPLVPIALATGWSALILFAVRVPLNPMSVTLGVLVIAISTEFSVLLSERYRQERLSGAERSRGPASHLRTHRRRGSGVGVTAIAGFGVLVLSDIRMLRDFGLVTLIDLSVSLLGVLVALPAALVFAERPRAISVRVPRLGGVRRHRNSGRGDSARGDSGRRDSSRKDSARRDSGREPA